MHEVGAGMILRESRSQRNDYLCRIEEGIALALTWTTLAFSVETDSGEALQLIREDTPNTSVYAARVQVIRELLRERKITLAKINRDANRARHELAKIGRVQNTTAT
jgi:hypothetical protein